MTLMPNSKDTKRNLVCPLAMNERHHHIDDDQNLGESDELNELKNHELKLHRLGIRNRIIIQNMIKTESKVCLPCLAYVICASFLYKEEEQALSPAS